MIKMVKFTDILHYIVGIILVVSLYACEGKKAPPPPTETTVENTPDGSVVTTNTIALSNTEEAPKRESLSDIQDRLVMVILDCGKIAVNDMGIFANDGSLDGQTERLINTCFYIQHPKGSLIWDTGLPSMLAGEVPTDAGDYQLSLDRTLWDQLADLDIYAEEITYLSISHSHFDHVGQMYEFADANWILHEAEWKYINEEAEQAVDESSIPLEAYRRMGKTLFVGECDIFGDGSVVVFETPGPTPGHSSLLVSLPETGPVLLTGDLYHRVGSRVPNNPAASKIPKFNPDEKTTRESMARFEARASSLGAKVIIQHAPESVPEFPYIMK